jgi:hypothetical protein
MIGNRLNHRSPFILTFVIFKSQLPVCMMYSNIMVFEEFDLQFSDKALFTTGNFSNNWDDWDAYFLHIIALINDTVSNVHSTTDLRFFLVMYSYTLYMFKIRLFWTMKLLLFVFCKYMECHVICIIIIKM